MARPSGAQRAALLQALDVAPGTSRELARRAGIDDMDVVTSTLRNMVSYGNRQAQVLRYERVPGRNRPVPVYGRLREQQDAANSNVFSQLGLALFGGSVGVGA